MIVISHRGNIDGENKALENSLDYIDAAIALGYQVEVDIRLTNGLLYLGHDVPQYVVSHEWLKRRSEYLWIHCKNVDVLNYFTRHPLFNYFWHDQDVCTFTSKGYIWAYPGVQPILGSIAVLPERFNDNVSVCKGICTDYPKKYR